MREHDEEEETYIRRPGESDVEPLRLIFMSQSSWSAWAIKVRKLWAWASHAPMAHSAI
jgi:hypothetical protein